MDQESHDTMLKQYYLNYYKISLSYRLSWFGMIGELPTVPEMKVWSHQFGKQVGLHFEDPILTSMSQSHCLNQVTLHL